MSYCGITGSHQNWAQPKTITRTQQQKKAVQELEYELFHTNPSGGDTNPVQLAVATALLNTWIRRSGLSSREMWTQRDQLTTQLPMVDQELTHNQHESCTSNHQNSQRSKAPHARSLPDIPIEAGDIVYFVADKSKTQDRDHYLVIATYGSWFSISIFTGSQLCATVYRVKSLPVSRYHLITSPPIPLLQWHQTLRKITRQILQTPTRPACHSISFFNLNHPLHRQRQVPRSPLLKHHPRWPPHLAWSWSMQIWTCLMPSPLPCWLSGGLYSM